jgi:DNA-directed RNA polymerase specialized sigma24 family protein
MAMQSLWIDGKLTREADLSDWQTFSLAYYDSILRAFRFLRVSEADTDDLAHSFLIKTAEGNFLEAFGKFRDRERASGKSARFRGYLYQSLQNHTRDFYRRRARDLRQQPLDPVAAASIISVPDLPLDPDAIYALDILHQALQSLRSHCERTGKPHLWVVFEETLLADEFRGRSRKSRAELLAMLGRDDPQALDNALTTAKRAFRRLVQEVIPQWPGENADPSSRFADWLEILRRSNASQYDLLHLAYRVTPRLDHSSQANSASMIVREARSRTDDRRPEVEPAEALSDDEMGVLLGFWLEMPLTRWLEPSEWAGFLPIFDRFYPTREGRVRPDRAGRSPCLLTILAPDPEESVLAKQLHLRTNHAVPGVFSELIYTAIATLAILRYQTSVHTIGSMSLAKNVRWFLGQSWLDGRLRPLLEAGLGLLKSSTADEPRPLANP